MNHRLPDDHTVQAAFALAVRAPSVHNVQPWLFRVDDRRIHLFLDPARALPSTDPDHRDLVVSCGAALHHLRIAFAAKGWLAGAAYPQAVIRIGWLPTGASALPRTPRRAVTDVVDRQIMETSAEAC